MNTQRIYLYKDRQDVYIDTYVCMDSCELSTGKRPAVLVIPGGGYGFCSDREGEPVARKFLAAGYHCFVLYYSVGEKASMSKDVPQPLLDASKAMAVIRENADAWQVIRDRIAVIGFSAGGHLAGCLGTLWNKQEITNTLHIPFGMNRPNALMLSYSVISAGEYAHRGSFENLYGGQDIPQDWLDCYSLEKQVGSHTPPAFLWHTAEDTCVPVENTLLFASALSKAKIPFEAHIFPKGEHGMSTANAEVGRQDAHVGRWTELAVEWLDETFANLDK